MTTLVLIKRLGALRAVDEAGEEALRAIAEGSQVKADITQPRNLRFHRWFFAMLKFVADNNPNFATSDDVLIYLKLKLNLFTPVIFPDGTTYLKPGSISFSRMDETEFRSFVKRCIDILAEHWMAGVTSEEVQTEFWQRVA
jgi:hypothetical protein